MKPVKKSNLIGNHECFAVGFKNILRRITYQQLCRQATDSNGILFLKSRITPT
jgi:hypothetical protein